MTDGIDIKTQFIDLRRARIQRIQYTDGTPALVANGLWEGDEPEQMVLTVNCSAYGETRMVIGDYSEYEGLPAALEALGLVRLIAPVQIGYGSGWAVEYLGDAS